MRYKRGRQWGTVVAKNEKYREVLLGAFTIVSVALLARMFEEKLVVRRWREEVGFGRAAERSRRCNTAKAAVADRRNHKGHYSLVRIISLSIR